MTSPCASYPRAEERRARAQKEGSGTHRKEGSGAYLPPNKRHNKPRLTSSISQTEGAKAWTSLLYAWIETEREEGEFEVGLNSAAVATQQSQQEYGQHKAVKKGRARAPGRLPQTRETAAPAPRKTAAPRRSARPRDCPSPRRSPLPLLAPPSQWRPNWWWCCWWGQSRWRRPGGFGRRGGSARRPRGSCRRSSRCAHAGWLACPGPVWHGRERRGDGAGTERRVSARVVRVVCVMACVQRGSSRPENRPPHRPNEGGRHGH